MHSLEIPSCAARYGLTKSGVRKLISEWKVRAVAAGYIQDIRSESVAAPVPPDLIQLEADDQPPSDQMAPAFSWDVPLSRLQESGASTHLSSKSSR